MDELEYEQRLAEVAAFLELDGVTDQLRHAFVTSSVTNDPTQNRERLEFRGDAVLQLLASDLFYDADSRASPGRLTEQVKAFVSNKTLAHLFEHTLRWDALIITRNPRADLQENRVKTLGSTLEAVIGAVYETAGLVAAGEFVNYLHNAYKSDVGGVRAQAQVVAAKNILQEWLAKFDHPAPTYSATKVAGSASHNPVWDAQVTIPVTPYNAAPKVFKLRVTGGVAKQAELAVAAKAVEWINSLSRANRQR